MHAVVALCADERSACGGDVPSGGFAEVASARHNIPNNPERSQRTIISPCTEEDDCRDVRTRRGVVSFEDCYRARCRKSMKNPGSLHLMRSDPGPAKLQDLRSF